VANLRASSTVPATSYLAVVHDRHRIGQREDPVDVMLDQQHRQIDGDGL
jgi:hypothetical protein